MSDSLYDRPGAQRAEYCRTVGRQLSAGKVEFALTVRGGGTVFAGLRAQKTSPLAGSTMTRSKPIARGLSCTSWRGLLRK